MWGLGDPHHKYVVFTGGEPLLQLDDVLIEALHAHGFKIAIETNGTLPQQLDNASKDQERELEMMLGVAMGLLEPATIIFMGGAVCVIVLAILTPIFEMTKLS